MGRPRKYCSKLIFVFVIIDKNILPFENIFPCLGDIELLNPELLFTSDVISVFLGVNVIEF